MNIIQELSNQTHSISHIISDNMKTFREAEKEEVLETEMNHNFEADMYLEKLEQDNEKVIQALLSVIKRPEYRAFHFLIAFIHSFINVENREIRRQRYFGHIFSAKASQ